MGSLTKEAIFAAVDQQVSEAITVEEWGGEVYIRSMTGHELQQWQSFMTLRSENGHVKSVTNITSFLLCLTLSDEKGNRLFGNSTADIEGLKNKCGPALTTLWDRAIEFNKLGEKEKDEEEKNSESIPTDDFGFDLPSSGDAP